jgi:hypothetical protein
LGLLLPSLECGEGCGEGEEPKPGDDPEVLEVKPAVVEEEVDARRGNTMAIRGSSSQGGSFMSDWLVRSTNCISLLRSASATALAINPLDCEGSENSLRLISEGTTESLSPGESLGVSPKELLAYKVLAHSPKR